MFKDKKRGFTIVELLIVIVVIGILAAIAIVAYNGIQSRARDAQRKSDIGAIVKTLEYYYADKGFYPLSSGSTVINSGWSTTADASWQNLKNVVAPYASNFPSSDPKNTSGSAAAATTTAYTYDYVVLQNSSYCNTPSGQGYILVYRLEASTQQQNLIGNCSGAQLGPYDASNYRKMIN